MKATLIAIESDSYLGRAIIVQQFPGLIEITLAYESL
jgi:hypothetical protein